MTKKDPQVTYCGPVDKTRCSAQCGERSAVYIFQDGTITYSDARLAITRQKDVSFDGMRQVLSKSPSNVCQPLVVEVHFRTTNQRENLLTQANKNGGYVSVPSKNGNQIQVKLLSTMPEHPKYNAYKIPNLPLGDPFNIRYEVRREIGCALAARVGYNYGDDDDDNVSLTVVDIVEGYEMNDDGSCPLYDGSLTIILNTSHLTFPPQFSFSYNGLLYTLADPTKHFLYCTSCKSLDSHATGEIRCTRKDRASDY